MAEPGLSEDPHLVSPICDKGLETPLCEKTNPLEPEADDWENLPANFPHLKYALQPRPECKFPSKLEGEV